MTDSKRPFGFWTATALVIGNMIGAGFFTLPAQLALFGFTSVAAWIAAIAGAMVIAWVIAGLSRAMPEATGTLAICATALGPLPGVLIGWSMWVGIWSANAYIALTAVRYLAVFWPPLAASSLPLVLGAVALLWLVTLLNLRGASTSGRFQVATTLIKLVPMAAIVLLLAQLGLGGELAMDKHPHAPFALGQLAPAVTMAFFAMVGFECAGMAAERVRDPGRTVTRATLTGVGVTGLIYLIACSGIIFAMPQDVIAGANAPVALFVETFWGRWAGLAIAGFAAVAAIGALNGWVLLQGEAPLGMARAGVIPASIGRSSKRDVPVGALIASTVLASVLILSNVSRDSAAIYDFMLRVTTAATLWFYAGACLSALVLGVARPAALVGLAFALWAIWGAGTEAVVLSLALMATAVPLYLLRPRATPVERSRATPVESGAQGLGAEVEILECASCSRSTPHLVLSADTDMATAGLVTLSSMDRNEVVLAEESALPRDRSDLRNLELLRSENQFDAAGLDFQQFMKVYKPPRLVFACPKCTHGEAVATKKLSLEAYREAGGIVTVVADVRLTE